MKKYFAPVAILIVLVATALFAQLNCSGGICTPANVGTGITDTTAIVNIAGGTTHIGPGAWPTSSQGQSGNRVAILDNGTARLIMANMTTPAPAADAGADIFLGFRMTDATPDLGGARLFGARLTSGSGTGTGYLSTLVSNAAGTFQEASRCVGVSLACTFNGQINGVTFGTATNCSSSASPAACGSAAAGSAAIPAAATTVTVNTTAMTANSQVQVTEDQSLGTKLGVTCNTQSTLIVGAIHVSSRTTTQFTAAVDVALTGNPMCFNYNITN